MNDQIIILWNFGNLFVWMARKRIKERELNWPRILMMKNIKTEMSWLSKLKRHKPWLCRAINAGCR